MKRLNSCDSLGGLMSICPNSTVDVDDHYHGKNPAYSRDFQTMLEGLDEEDCVEESSLITEKKRRLSVDQVKALEKNFGVENKLEPERKVKLAQELGLQPRQVAVWFQNRRARWKAKQLERDYAVLKANYDVLKHKFETLQRENESLHNEIRELKSKLNGSNGKIYVKEEASLSDSEEKCDLEIHDAGVAIELNSENCDVKENETVEGVAIFGDFKDGSSDSDSSAILNEDNSPIAGAISSSGGILHHSPHRLSSIHGGGLTNSAVNTGFGLSGTKTSTPGDANKVYQNQTQFVKIEEHNFLGEESCITLLSDDQAPTLHWYCNDEWN